MENDVPESVVQPKVRSGSIHRALIEAVTYDDVGEAIRLLEKVENRGNKSISEIAKELKKTRGMLYQHLRELQDGGYVDDEFKITDAGRLALL